MSDPSVAATELAERALAVVFGDPRSGLVLADKVLAGASRRSEAAVVAGRAAALAELQLGRVDAARRRLERAVKAAAESGLTRREAEARQSLAFVLLQTEEPEAALRQLDAALEVPRDPGIVALMHSQRSLLLMRLGHYAEALEESDEAVAWCTEAGMLTHLSHVHANRGIVFSYLGRFDEAAAELNISLGLCRQQESKLGIAQVIHNLGFLAARRGDVPEALRLYDEAFARYQELGVSTNVLFVDRCEVLMAANLLAEARRAAEQAVLGLEAAGLAADLAEGRLMLAEVAFADGDYEVAKECADGAARGFARQRREGWSAHAHYVSARAGWSLGAPDRVVIRQATQLAGRLEAAGWRLQALEARIEAAKAAMRSGSSRTAIRILDQVTDRSGASAEERVRTWYSKALARLAGGKRAGALRALEAGLRVAEQHRATFGATELRVRTAIQSAELADLGLELVLERGEARSVLAWAERWRARSLWTPDARPPDDRELAQHLAELRQTVASLEQAVLSGSEQRDELEVRRARIEAEIRSRALRRTQEGGRQAPEPPSLLQLQEELGRRTLVELVDRAGELYAVVCRAGSSRVVRLGESATAERERAGVQFALARLALRRNAAASLLASAQLLARATGNLDAQLLQPLAPELEGDHEVVIVPTGDLHALPWALLPSLSGRPLSVAPSAGLWLARARTPSRSEAVVLVGGPNVPFATEELEQLQALYPEATMLDEVEATGAVVLQALRGVGVAHVAAHGRFRSDNPLFSSLDLADGPLTVYDLEQLSEPAEVMILSACDAGRSQVHPGNELMGTTAALLSLGTRAIVASVAPVPDEGAADVMVRLHRRLKLGETTGGALADAQTAVTVADLSAEELAAGSERALRALAGGAFVCFGAGG